MKTAPRASTGFVRRLIFDKQQHHSAVPVVQRAAELYFHVVANIQRFLGKSMPCSNRGVFFISEQNSTLDEVFAALFSHICVCVFSDGASIGEEAMRTSTDANNSSGISGSTIGLIAGLVAAATCIACVLIGTLDSCVISIIRSLGVLGG